MIQLFTNNALRVGFAAGSMTGIPVGVPAQTRPVNAGVYSFTVYSGNGAVATMSGPENVGTEWTEVVVADPSLASGLAAGPPGERASSGPRLQVTWVKMVVTTVRRGFELVEVGRNSPTPVWILEVSPRLRHPRSPTGRPPN